MFFHPELLHHIWKKYLPNIALRDKLRAILLGVAMLVIPNQVFPQACCSGGVPLGGSLGLGTADHKSLQFLLTYDYNLLNDLMDVSVILPDDTRQRTTHSSIFEVNYGVSSRFSFAVVIPLIRQERRIRSFGGGIDFNSSQGLGDAAILLKYRVFDYDNTPDTDWVIGAGPKFPTGRTDFVNNSGFIMAADMQPGSGSWDGLFWSFFQQRKVWLPNLSLMAVTTVRLSGNNPDYNQTQTYKFGNEYQFSSGINYNTYMYWPFDIFTWFRYRYQSEDLIDDNAFPGSGGEWVYIIPGINVYFHPRMSWRFSFDIPLYRKLEGTQLTTTYRFTTAISYTLFIQN